ncbi:creatininase family protein [Dyadobacter sediminis]|uniref:Creatininase family protein n=1 Tax=Dyadobacter sediminis TaxID=1493691 RepID=A0A5R9K7J1_9BACT|nr:creatininase family protein [Dyadobacter sediminis]TLU89827.1 creatininase family protein [Dyadobacter sediminis]GGC12483.1 creatininase [Dyadobacter sediminis]
MLFSNLSYPVINQLTEEAVIVLPLGATEQHGLHLPVSTDTDIVTRLALATEMRMTNEILLCPTLPFGSSHHHLSFGGTVSLNPLLYTQTIVDLVKSFVESGFRKIVLLNGHGGNITPVKQALAMLSCQYDFSLKPNIALVTYWELAGKSFAGQLPMQSPALSHACEYETSLMLHLFPDKVRMENVERSVRPESNGYVAWEDDEPYRGVTLFKQTSIVSSNGNSGEPQLATAEKGEILFNQAVQALETFITAFHSWPLLGRIDKKE